jgi:hypothetical protein
MQSQGPDTDKPMQETKNVAGKNQVVPVDFNNPEIHQDEIIGMKNKSKLGLDLGQINSGRPPTEEAFD